MQLFQDDAERETDIISPRITEPQFVSSAQEDWIVVCLENAQINSVTDSYVKSSTYRQREVRRTRGVSTIKTGDFQFCAGVGNAGQYAYKRRDSTVVTKFVLWPTQYVEDANFGHDITA